MGPHEKVKRELQLTKEAAVKTLLLLLEREYKRHQ